MIFLQIFWVFSRIGIVNFGGGYAMLSLIQREVVNHQGWLTATEFTDIVAVSQMTPGPIGINAATYIGYSAVVQAGYPPAMGVIGSVIATLSIIWLPFLLMLLLSRFLMKYKDHPRMRATFSALRPAIIGLIAAAALGLMTVENFGFPELSKQFVASILLFGAAFVLAYRYKFNPLLLIGLSALVGIGLYSW